VLFTYQGLQHHLIWQSGIPYWRGYKGFAVERYQPKLASDVPSTIVLQRRHQARAIHDKWMELHYRTDEATKHLSQGDRQHWMDTWQSLQEELLTAARRTQDEMLARITNSMAIGTPMDTYYTASNRNQPPPQFDPT
jgi:hypothetical protein